MEEQGEIQNSTNRPGQVARSFRQKKSNASIETAIGGSKGSSKLYVLAAICL
jgi:hypothetical protein